MGRRWGMDFDEDKIRRLVRSMTPRSRFYQVLREELTLIGRWKNRPRGNPALGKMEQSRRSENGKS